MPEDKKNEKFKLNFFYFLIVSSIIILIIFIFIISSFWSYWSKIWRIEEFYKEQNKSANVSPTLNRLDPSIGDNNAKVILIEYTDFACNACKNTNDILNEIKNIYGNRIKIVFKALPVINELLSKKAAVAAYCAGEQNKFWEFKDLLFENNNILFDETFYNLAGALGLNQQNFTTCLNSQKYDALINNNIAEALKLQIISIPTIYINNEQITEYVAVNTLKNIIDNKLNQ